jgi:hypothetical protein
MELHKFIKHLHYGSVGYYPFYWAIKGKNIVITTGKTGTNTLKYYSDSTSDDGFLNLHLLLNYVYEKGFKIHILMREPNSRFKTGIFQELLLIYQKLSKPYNKIPKIDLTNIKKWNEDEWVINLEKFIIEYIDILNNEDLKDVDNKFTDEPYFNFHIGNWLNIVSNLLSIFTLDKVKIWEYTDFNKLLSYLDCNEKNDKVINKSEDKPFINEYLKAYNKLSNDTRVKISIYLNDEVKIWDELIQSNKKYISIFDREPPPPPINNILDEIPDEKTDKTRRP